MPHIRTISADVDIIGYRMTLVQTLACIIVPLALEGKKDSLDWLGARRHLCTYVWFSNGRYDIGTQTHSGLHISKELTSASTLLQNATEYRQIVCASEKHQASYSSVGRASDCGLLQQSNEPWLDSLWLDYADPRKHSQAW